MPSHNLNILGEEICYNTTMKNAAKISRNLLLAGVALLAVSGCRPYMLYAVEPEGPAEYQLGWQDGCDTGLSADSPMFYKFMYGFKKRPEMGANDLYKQGWNEGFTYCRFSISATDKSADPAKGVFGVFQ
jgi:hypothetical protein